MIGKKEWFKRRKYSGWGLMPAKWQGWAYTAIMVAPLIVLQYFPVNEASLVIIIAWFVLFAVDFASIMIELPADEREKAHEAFAERNALWTMLAVLATGSAFVVAGEVAQGMDPANDPALLVILAGVICGLVAKAATNWYLDRNN
jgi:hypothetical protein